MSERKNIDRLFQEKFKEFEVTPPNDTWGNIEAKLDGKKKRRIVPFWWKLSGVAAVFLIGFLVSKSIYDTGIQTTNPVVNENNSDSKGKTTIEDVHLKNIKENVIPTENPVVNQNNAEQTSPKNEKDFNDNKNTITSKDAVASDKNKDNAISEEKNNKQKSAFSSKSSVAERQSSKKRSLKNKSNSEKEVTPIAESVYEKSQNQVVQNSKNKQSNADKNIVPTDSKNYTNETLGTTEQKNINLDALKGEINSKIASKEIEKKVNDTAAISVADNELEKLLNEKESILKKKESKINRWQLTSNVAPIFLGSASNGSPIDPSLSKNSKSYNTNIGYGLGVSYAVNKKFSVRTGLNKVNMGYDTNDISFFTGIQAKTLAGVKPTSSSAMIHVESNIAPASDNLEAGLLPFEANITQKSSGYLRQEMGYIEMPVEMTYNLLDKKFGMKLIGGFSTLFLQDNTITLVSQDRGTVLGEANNLNDLHFSTNLGLGLKYSFYKSFEFNVEPTVKYQLNTYNANAGNFKPYYFGIYSGISYKF